MVFFNRKPVEYMSEPEIDNGETQVWQIPQTGEIFVEYQAYLNRMGFYKQRRFTCEITCHAGLPFFEALKTELAAAKKVEEACPDALKGPILQRVAELQILPRIDTLVDRIFNDLQGNFYLGEAVVLRASTGENVSAMVELVEGTVLPDRSSSHYIVRFDERPAETERVAASYISRDRKVFTKKVLKFFIKKSVTRRKGIGAPWVVKKEFADKYKINQRIYPECGKAFKKLEAHMLTHQNKRRSAQSKHAITTSRVSDENTARSIGRHAKEVKRRVKTGCLTCRKHKIKCDEQHPACRNCQKSKRECLGYDPLFIAQPSPDGRH